MFGDRLEFLSMETLWWTCVICVAHSVARRIEEHILWLYKKKRKEITNKEKKKLWFSAIFGNMEKRYISVYKEKKNEFFFKKNVFCVAKIQHSHSKSVNDEARY